MADWWDCICEHCGIMLAFPSTAAHVMCPLCGVDFTLIKELDQAEEGNPNVGPS
jgi:LSD1 subclass zinc finger protein